MQQLFMKRSRCSFISQICHARQREGRNGRNDRARSSGCSIVGIHIRWEPVDIQRERRLGPKPELSGNHVQPLAISDCQHQLARGLDGSAAEHRCRWLFLFRVQRSCSDQSLSDLIDAKVKTPIHCPSISRGRATTDFVPKLKRLALSHKASSGRSPNFEMLIVSPRFMRSTIHGKRAFASM